MRPLNLALAVALAMTATPSTVEADEVPAGWIKAGSAPAQYEVGVDKSERRGDHAVVFVRATPERTAGFGTLMQMASPGEFAGKRVRFAADVRSEKIDVGWAGLWFRVDGPDSGPGKSLAFDNMQKRPIKGTTGWTRVEIVLDVPKEAAALAFGLLLAGDGEVRMGDLKMEVVPDTVPTTDLMRAEAPRNLNFED